MLPDMSIFQLLRLHHVPFVIVGGHAVYFHRVPRMTEDADVVWIRSVESEKALLAALTQIDACSIGKEIDPDTKIEKLHPVSMPYIQANHLMMVWTKYGFLDLFDYIPGYPDEDPNELMKTSIEADGQRFASLHWLRRMKEKAGREKDLLDLKNLPLE